MPDSIRTCGAISAGNGDTFRETATAGVDEAAVAMTTTITGEDGEDPVHVHARDPAVADTEEDRVIRVAALVPNRQDVIVKTETLESKTQ